MARVEEYLEHLVQQHDDHMQAAYSRLVDGVDPEELAISWAYGAGLLHAIRTIQEALKER